MRGGSKPVYNVEWREKERARWRKYKIRQRERNNAAGLTSKGKIPIRKLRGAHKKYEWTDEDDERVAKECNKSDQELDAIAMRDPVVAAGRKWGVNANPL